MGAFQKARSDRVFLANAIDSGLPASYSGAELKQISQTEAGANHLRMETEKVLAWFGQATSSTKIVGPAQ
jgi:hypothetical protein